MTHAHKPPPPLITSTTLRMHVSMLQHSPVQKPLPGGCHTSDHILKALPRTYPPRGAVVAAWWSVGSINI